MTVRSEAAEQGVPSNLLCEIVFGTEKTATHAAAPAPVYTPEERSQLETLCARVFESGTLVSSGRLKLMGLDKVRRQGGGEWRILQEDVFKVVDDILPGFMRADDIFFRLQDDTYVIVFANLDREQAETKALAIAVEVRKRVFDSSRPELTGVFLQCDVTEIEPARKRVSEKIFTPAMQRLRREAAIPVDKIFIQGYMLPEEAIVQDNSSQTFEKKIACHYQPLWDLHKNALTTYVCLPREAAPKSAENDLALLETVIAELIDMCASGRRFLVACPVRHETLYRHDSFEKILSLCARMPEDVRKLLVFIVVDFRDDLPRATCFWFLPALKNCCKSVFARLYLTEKWDFNVLRNAGFDAVGVNIEEAGDGEQGMMKRLTAFSDGAKAAMISRTFAIGVATRSLATYCVCMGFGYLGGTAVHDMVAAPDSIYRYRNEDLFAALIANIQVAK